MKEQQEIGIDPLLLLASLWRKKILILLVAIITGGLVFIYCPSAIYKYITYLCS